MWQFPLKTWEPGNHPYPTDVSLRHVGWFGGAGSCSSRPVPGIGNHSTGAEVQHDH
jgi:hypothetical protein